VTARPSRRERAASDVVAAFRAGDTVALARALSWIEDGDPRGRDVLRAVYSRTGGARVIGVTGAPGAGKSTLVDRLAAQLAAQGRRVAVVAVDPSSAFSGGAILGDRIRMRDAQEQGSVFIRSMATRGHLGGLARATEDALDLLDAFGFTDVLLETVGVGQDEVEVIQVAHVNLVVLVPFMGDDVQAIKAGIMEIADSYVINKCDREGADRMESHVRAMLQLYDTAPREVPILRTVATRGDGVAEVLATCLSLLDQRAGERGEAARRERARRRLVGLLGAELLRAHLAQPGARDALDDGARRVVARESDPHAVAAELAGGGALEAAIDHLGLAVSDRAAALRFWQEGMGLSVGCQEDLAPEGVRATMLPVGAARVELLEPLPGDGPVARFLRRRGPGLHHLCVEVADIEAALSRLRAAGARILGEAPRRGVGGRLVAFVDPQSAHGVLVELSQRPRVPEEDS
jgi:LAO/AO transport system kinase